MKVTIDRFEESFVVCETEQGEMINIKKSLLPKTANEGDILNISVDKIELAVEEIKARKEEIKKLTEGIWD